MGVVNCGADVRDVVFKVRCISAASVEGLPSSVSGRRVVYLSWSGSRGGIPGLTLELLCVWAYERCSVLVRRLYSLQC